MRRRRATTTEEKLINNGLVREAALPELELRPLVDLMVRKEAAPMELRDAHSQYENCHMRLQSVTIHLGFVEKAPSAGGGKRKSGYVKKISDDAKVIMAGNDQAQAVFLLVLAKDQWLLASTDRRLVILDHLLCRIGFNGKGAPCLVKPDVEEFLGVIKRGGIEHLDEPRQSFAGACAEAVKIRQLSLDEAMAQEAARPEPTPEQLEAQAKALVEGAEAAPEEEPAIPFERRPAAEKMLAGQGRRL